jgi:hypothetical protein
VADWAGLVVRMAVAAAIPATTDAQTRFMKPP